MAAVCAVMAASLLAGVCMEYYHLVLRTRKIYALL